MLFLCFSPQQVISDGTLFVLEGDIVTHSWTLRVAVSVCINSCMLRGEKISVTDFRQML